jgi:hypothetical protein
MVERVDQDSVSFFDPRMLKSRDQLADQRFRLYGGYEA